MKKSKNTKTSGVLLTVILCATLLTACDKTLEPIIPGTTKPLDESALEGLVSVTGSGEVLTFEGAGAQVDSIAENDIIVAGVSGQTPDGLLRKVTDVRRADGRVVLETVQATLEEAVQQGELSVELELSPSQLRTARPLCRGVSFAPGGSQLGTDFEISMDDVILYDADGDNDTEDDQVKASGGITFSPGFEFGVEIRWFSLQKIVFKNTTEESAELKIETAVELWGIEDEKEIARYRFAPITVFIGAVPVVITPELTVSAGVEGSASVTLSTEVSQNVTIEAGLEYSSSRGWRPVKSFSNTYEFEPPSLEGEASLKGYSGPELDLKLYGAAGPSAAVSGYLELEAGLTGLKLYGGLSADIGVEVEVLGDTLAEYEANVLDEKELLYEVSLDNETTTTSTAAGGATTTTSAPETDTTTAAPVDTANTFDLTEFSLPGTFSPKFTSTSSARIIIAESFSESGQAQAPYLSIIMYRIHEPGTYATPFPTGTDAPYYQVSFMDAEGNYYKMTEGTITFTAFDETNSYNYSRRFSGSFSFSVEEYTENTNKVSGKIAAEFDLLWNEDPYGYSPIDRSVSRKPRPVGGVERYKSGNQS